jgi:alkylhydroperoxidase/carboxymuconolactone decarboxylase family protein YurZ
MEIKNRYPELIAAYENLGEHCQKAGPLNPKERAIAKLAIAIGAGLEGGVHSHARRALDAGLTPDEIRHTALLGLTTIGFPSMMKALAWVEDVLGKTQA